MVRRLEGILLTVYGCLLLFLMLSGRYGLYMNPKYMWLTFLSALMLLVYGVHGAVNPPEHPKPFYTAVIALLIILMLAVPARELGAGDMLFSPF
jgi:hypothetical protein